MNKFFAAPIMFIFMLLTLSACGSRLEGTYQCVDPSEYFNRYIRFSDGKVYKNSSDSFNGRTGWPYKIKGDYIQETSIGVSETEFSLKGDRLTYGGKEYVNVDSNAIKDAVEESMKLLEDFDGKYTSGSHVLEIDSNNNSIKSYSKNNPSKTASSDLFYLKVDGDTISGAFPGASGSFSFKAVEDSLLSTHGDEYIREGCRSIYYGVYKTEYEESRWNEDRRENETVTVAEYIGIDENGTFSIWAEGSANFYAQTGYINGVAEDLSFKINSGSASYQPDSAMETITLNAGETNEKVYTRVEGVTIPKQ